MVHMCLVYVVPYAVSRYGMYYLWYLKLLSLAKDRKDKTLTTSSTQPNPSPFYTASQYPAAMTQLPPKKYVKINGVMKLNPEFTKWKESQAGGNVVGSSMPNAAQALPVVSCMEDHMQLNSDLGTSIPLAESTDATIAMMQDADFCQDAGMNSDTMVDELGGVLAKYEVPMGLMNKVRGRRGVIDFCCIYILIVNSIL